MAVTFPSSPAGGDQFTAGNKVFQRFGTRWRRVAGIVVWESGTAPSGRGRTAWLDEIDGGNA